MMTEGISRPLRWKELCQAAMLESDWTKLPPLLEDAINAVLDQIEITVTGGELEELNSVLNGLRSRRRESRVDSPSQTKAA